MVKGVNKSVIEITETGSEIFSKIILFVAPDCKEKDSAKVNKEAERLINKIKGQEGLSLRQAVHKQRKRKKRVIIFSLFMSLAIIASLLLLFL